MLRAVERIGPYRVLRQLGEGGMGVVYAAEDTRTGGAVALKVLRGAAPDVEARRRFEREARVVRDLTDARLCRTLEVGELDGQPYIVMELLEGETLADRLVRGPLPLAHAVGLACDILGGLAALHAHGVVHRDLKPSNVFLTSAGVRILDFGLARSLPKGDMEVTASAITQAGSLLGTPAYMAPEQVRGSAAEARTDLYAVAAMLFEMVSGRRLFAGRTIVETLHATLYEPPPALGGSAEAAALDRVLRPALSKSPSERPADARALSDALAAILDEAESSGGSTPRIVSLTRLLVLPLRVLRPDPDTDFLAFSLPDAITSSLADLQALVVRSSVVAQRYAGEADLARIAREAEVDIVLSGTLMRAGEKIRVALQLAEVPAAEVLWSHTVTAATGDLFELEADLVGRIVESLAVPLTAREHGRLRPEAAVGGTAYQIFLRANEVGRTASGYSRACALYEESLALDESYAPAWARLARTRRLLAKYDASRRAEGEKAEEAVQRALALDPELALAHSTYAQLEMDGGRTQDAMVRLLRLGQSRRTDSELMVGLVAALRYCGLLEASLLAHEAARRLDPNAPTSVNWTLFVSGEFARAAAAASDEHVGPAFFVDALTASDDVLRARCLGEERTAPPLKREGLAAVRAMIDGDLELLRAKVAALRATPDPEVSFILARLLARAGLGTEAMVEIESAWARGYTSSRPLLRDPWLASVRELKAFPALLARTQAREAEAQAAYAAAGGPALLGPDRASRSGVS
jgi:serine/threonine protein kinase